MADVKLVKSIYTVGDVTSLGELAAADNAKIPGSLEVVGAIIGNVIKGDGTAGRVLRFAHLVIENGTNASTLKCTLVSDFNGDAIGETDNIAKNATTGNFTLSADGTLLTIEAAGLSGNALAVLGSFYYNASAVALLLASGVAANDITIFARHATTGAAQDLTVLVDTGTMGINLVYITSA